MNNIMKIIVLLLFILVNTGKTLTPGSPVDFTIEATHLDFSNQMAEIELNMIPATSVFNEVCGQVVIEIITYNGLVYNGENSWTEHFNQIDSISTVLNFNIPENDTSFFEISFECDNTDYIKKFEYYFVSIDDTLEFWHGNPRYNRPFPKPSHIPKKRIGHVIPGEFPYLDSLLGVGDTTALSKLPTTESRQIPESDVWEYRKKKLEEKPLDDKPFEMIYIDGVMWRRDYGEQFFRIEEPITNTEEFSKRRMDSLMALPPDHLFEICVSSENPNSIDSLKVMFDTMPTILDGKYFHLKATRAQMDHLHDLGFIFTHNGSHKNCIHELLEKKQKQ